MLLKLALHVIAIQSLLANRFNPSYFNLINENVNVVSPYKDEVFVEGVVENSTAMQLDGYSTWIQDATYFPQLNDGVVITIWFALPSYPSSSAALFATKALEVGIDRYGQLVLLFGLVPQGSYHVKASETPVPRHQWVHLVIALNTTQETTKVYTNGQLQKEILVPLSKVPWPATDEETEYYIGRHPFNVNSQQLFDMYVFNGIIAEVSFRSGRTDDVQVDQNHKEIMRESKQDLSFKLEYVDDFHRPRLHPMPQQAWANEPHGFVLHNGTYHLFFQKNGNGPHWHHITWGHLSSPDLINWTEHPIILWPELGLDQAGIWSGHVVIPEEGEYAGIPTLFYTGVDGWKAGIFVANGSDDLMSWDKYGKTELSARPVIEYRPKGMFEGDDFRDPFLFNFEGSWYMIVGTGIDTAEGRMGSLFLYTADDLYTFDWIFLGPIFTGNDTLMEMHVGRFWEMPVFLQIDDVWLLVVNKTPTDSDPARTLYWTGDFDGFGFYPYENSPVELELFVGQLSPTVTYDEEGRLVAIGISPDTWNAFHDDSIQHAQVGWANVFTFPKIWYLSADGRINRAPHPSLIQLREEQIVQQYSPASNFLCSGKRMLEIQALFECQKCEKVGLVLFKSSSEETSIYYDFQQNKVVLDRHRSSLDENAKRDLVEANYKLSKAGIIAFHLFIDHSIIEVFLNEEDSFVTRVFPIDPESTIMELLREGQEINVTVDVWSLSL